MNKKDSWIKKMHDFLLDDERISSELRWIVKVWYIIILIRLSIYVFQNFNSITDFTFFDEFNGKNLLFIFWLILMIIPFFDSFEGFGVSIKRNRGKQDKKLDKALNSSIGTVDKNDTVDNLKDELEKKLKFISEEGGYDNE